MVHVGQALTPTHRPDGTEGGEKKKLQPAAASVKLPEIKGVWQQCEPEYENRLVVRRLVLNKSRPHY